MSGYERPEGGWRFQFRGVKINDTPDALQPYESPFAKNIRTYKDNSVQTRPGYSLAFAASGVITDLRAYSALGTDNLPRVLSRNSANGIYLDTGTLLATLDGSSQGAFLIPYRPNQSPQSWMYIGAAEDYKKFSAPDATNQVTVYNVGIPEQQAPPEACPEAFNFYEFSSNAAGWTNAGTAGGTTNVARVTDTLGSVLEDPASGTTKRCSCEVTNTSQYQTGMSVVVDALGTPIHAVVQDVLAPIAGGTTLKIDSIYYFAGTSGRCVIVPTQQPANPSVPAISNNVPAAASIYSDAVLSSLRRGSIINLDNGVDPDENLFVLSVTRGPNGTICFEVETTATYATSDDLTGVGAISLSGVTSANTGDTIDATVVNSALTGPGTGTLSQALATNPFEQLMPPSNNTPQSDDYIAFSVYISDLSKFIQGTITFNTEPGAPGYNVNGFYAQFDSSNLVFHQPAVSSVTQIQNPLGTNLQSGQLDLSQVDINGLAASVGLTPEELIAQVQANNYDGNIAPPPDIVTNTTPLPANQYTTVMFPVRALIRLGNDLTKTLADCNGVRVSIQTSDSVTLRIGSFWVGGGGQADVGNSGSPYFYAVRGRNSLTGALSNPSPISLYGVSPRRQQVRVTMTDDSGDSQLDTWDVFRYGGSITSWRYIGSTPNTGGTDEFIDNYFDTAALGGSVLDYDNFEPWPTIDVPYNATAGVASGITTAIDVVGNTILVTYSAAAAFTDPAPDTILRWLPGTLVTLSGQNVYTLKCRPVAATLAAPPAHYYAYLFQLVENAGTITPDTLDILEPNVANQHLPYLWGPDAGGTIFGAGDPFRPGSFYFCKNFSPDSAPATYNHELTPPSEPILGGEVINGLAMVASSNRWWALYPQLGNLTQRYQAVEKPVGRGLAAPYAHCTDGKRIFFVAKDGVWVTGGGEGKSLTDDSLYNLFPHEGVNAVTAATDYTYATYTIYAPDYKYASLFRLNFVNGFLYFDYRDRLGTPRTLVCDLSGLDAFMGGSPADAPAWVPDFYADGITNHYAVEQPESTLESTSTRYPLIYMADSAGKVYTQQLNTNDNGTPINGVCATFEYNGGDIREAQLFNDFFVDATPVSGMQVRAVTDGINFGPVKNVPASATRIQTNAPVGSELKYMGAIFVWTDDFSTQSAPTMLHAWQPMYQGVPISVFQWKTQATSFGWPAYGHLRQWNIAYRAAETVTITINSYDGTSPAQITLPATGNGGLDVEKLMVPFTFNKGMLYDFLGVSDGEWAPYLSESELFCGAWARTEGYQLVHDIDAPKGIRS